MSSSEEPGDSQLPEAEETSVEAPTAPGAALPAAGSPLPDDSGVTEVRASGPHLQRFDVNVKPPPTFRAPRIPGRLAPGDVLAGRFSVLRFVARGGMGDVYEAEDLELGGRVALKTIRLESATDPRVLERFRREIHLARQITHPNVCRIDDVFHHRDSSAESLGEEPEELTFLTMEFLPGITLSEHLRRHGPMTVDQALPVVKQIVAALQAAHEAGVVHRDMKAANVLLVPPEREGDGTRVVVTDFGIARGLALDDGVTGTMTVMGTPAYMAPEQLRAGPLTPATDLYALGVMMFEMLTGRRPFQGGAVSTASRRLRDTAPLPSTVVPGLSPRWDRAVARCLERDPEERFSSAMDVVAALEGEDVEPPVSTLRRRRNLLLGFGGTAAAILIVVIALRAGRTSPPAGAAAVEPVEPPGPTAYSTVQVTTSAGLDLYPAFAPDGRSLAFSSDRSGTFEIYVQSLAAGGRTVPLTTDGQQSFQPAFSPDGQWVAYHSKGRGGIWLVPALGGVPRQLTEFGSRPAFSPDGAFVVFQSEPLVDLAANASDVVALSTIWIVATSGGQPKAVTQPGQPAGGHGTPSFSPDGRRIVFVSFDHSNAQFWIVARDGRELVPVPSRNQRRYDPVFSSDGRSLYFAGLSPTWNALLLKQPLDDQGRPVGEPRQVLDLGGVRMRHITMSRDGTRIAYAALTMPSNLWAIAMDRRTGQPGEPRPLTAETGRASRPAFSPDGSLIAFVKWRPGGGQRLWLVQPDGTKQRQLTHSEADDFMPSFFPDGDRIAYRSVRAGRSPMMAVSLSTGASETLFTPPVGLDEPRLSPDGTLFAYQARNSAGVLNTYVVPVQGGSPRALTDEKELAGFPAWSPDGRTLALEKKIGDDAHVALVPFSGGSPRVLTRAPGQSWPYSFSPDGRRVLFSGQRDGIWNVFEVDTVTGDERALTGNRKLNAFVRYPAMSPRGDLVVYEYAETTGNVWLLDGLK